MDIWKEDKKLLIFTAVFRLGQQRRGFFDHCITD
jgi:hypothetical protein